MLAITGVTPFADVELPPVLFVWGPSRVVPVRLTSFSVTRGGLRPNPESIQAKVQLGMRVLSYADLKQDSIGHGVYLASQIQKEVLARLNMVGNVENLLKMLPI